MSDVISTIQESGNTLFAVNNELMALAELIDVHDAAELKMSEWGRSGLAAMLHRISEKISEANGNMPVGDEIERELDRLAMERAASIAVTRMGQTCGGMEADNE